MYDRSGRLTEIKHQKGTTVLSRFVATLDPVGNPTQVVRTGALAVTSTYTYDANDRLTGVCFQAGTCPGASDPFIRWTYDLVGNRSTEHRPSGTTSYAYNASDQLTTAGYVFDLNGNQTASPGRTYGYDQADRLLTTTGGGTTTTYLYDGDGNRVQASTGSAASAKTNYLWDLAHGLPQVAVERNGNNVVQRSYRYGIGRLSLVSGSNTFYYHKGWLDSTANMTSSAGATRWTYDYEPYGTLRVETSSGTPPANWFKFTGEYRDDTSLYHLRARQYDPTLGRFTRLDPLEQQTGSVGISPCGL